MNQQSEATESAQGRPRSPALRFVVLLGVVSLFADMTYEGARSVTGPFLAVLGASGTAVGLIAGLGELIGYSLRLASGYLADRTGRYWAITLVGYGLNMIAVPLLALAGRWEIAAALMICERVGKAIRTPARDAMLSHATHQVGHGWGFGLHEAMDQAGAVVGPLIVAAVLATGGEYRTGFAVLLVPATVTLGILLLARWLYPSPRDLEPATPTYHGRGFPLAFWLYLAAAALVAAGYADFPLIAYHFGKTSVVPAGWIPVFYAAAMGVDALAALAFGRCFDRFGLATLIVAVLCSAFFAPLVFLGGFYPALGGMALWGIGMGAQESILRAAIAGMIPRDRRGVAYGVFNSSYGLAWFAGSAAMGILYDVSLPTLIGFSVLVQLGAIPLLWLVTRGIGQPRNSVG
ncbi:MAG: MFS transporter [Isosphaeraceae bacterium]